MKLLMIAAARSPHTVRWANAFADAGITVHLISQYPLIGSLHHRVLLHRLPHMFGAGYIANGPRLRHVLTDIKPDIVNVHHASGPGTLARWVQNIPYVINVWGSDIYEFPHKSRLHRWLIRGNLTRADVVASTSKDMAARVRTIYPAIRRVEITPFGVDTSRFCSTGAGRRDAHPANDKLVIGTVKTLKPAYGIDTLLRAFRCLLDRLKEHTSSRLPRLELRIVGDGPARGSLMKLADALSIAKVTTFLGRIPHENVPAELARLDIFCALSRRESFGVAIVEASAARLPVVVSDVGGLPEVVVNGQTGFIVPANDPGAAAAVLERLVRSSDLRASLGRAGAHHVQRNYEWSRCVERMISLLDETLAVHPRRG